MKEPKMRRRCPKNVWFDFQLDLRARYSGGRRGGGTLAKGAAVAWGAYQVEVFLKDSETKPSQMGIVTGRWGGWGHRGRWNKDRWNNWRGGNDTVSLLIHLITINFVHHSHYPNHHRYHLHHRQHH